MDESSPAEELAMALGMALVRKGILDADDLITAAERVEGEHADTVAHLLNCIVIQAEAPSKSDWQAEQRRSQIHLVPDGGNKG